MDVKIKICGLSRHEDIEAVNAAMPDFIGFVFAPSSRRISPSEAAELSRFLNGKIKKVGVFVNEEVENISRLLKEGIIDMAQLHGDENDDYIRQLKSLFPASVIKAFRVTKEFRLEQVCPKNYDFVLFDAYSPQNYGGSGAVFDWNRAKGYKGPFFIAGGLDITNMEKCIRECRPYCVDISSGAEIMGRKSGEKIMELVRKVREATFE